MNFSFVLPSRGKKEDVLKMLDSFERTTKYKNKIEFLIAIDLGNTGIKEIVKERDYSFSVRFFERNKTKNFSEDYFNFLANKSTGKNIVAFNDDAWMRTDHWDKKILSEVKSWGRSIYMLDLLDTARIKYRHMFPCFPCVSRRAFCTLGFLLPREVRMYPADKVTHEIYLGAHSVIPIRDVLIEHEHVLESDESKKEMMDIFLEDQKKQGEIDISDYINRLLVASQSDIKRKNKFNRIMKILKEK